LDELFFALAAGYAAHWLITPTNHPEASGLAYAWAWTQVVGCIAAWFTLAIRRRACHRQGAQ
jgi:hypothetical protein